MSKKRVHELGKQLKEQGIELSNQELVEKLHQLGYDVKSHSSSLEDDQAASAYEKILGERKPKPAPARPAGEARKRRIRDEKSPRRTPPLSRGKGKGCVRGRRKTEKKRRNKCPQKPRNIMQRARCLGWGIRVRIPHFFFGLGPEEVAREGIEPPTRRFSVCRSTD